MVWMQRKLKCKVINSDYRPEGIPENKFIPVLGIETRRREKEFEGKKTIVEDVYFLVVTDRGKLITVGSFNCATMLDEESELKTNKAIELLSNTTIMWKVLNEKLQKISSESSTSENQGTG